MARSSAWIALCAVALAVGCDGEPPPAPSPAWPHAPVRRAAIESRRPFGERLAAALDEPWAGAPRPTPFGAHGDDWTVWLDPTTLADPDTVVRVDGGALHILDVAPGEGPMPFGYARSREVLGDFLLRFEYRFDGPRFAPRADAPRDSGVLYLIPDDAIDAIWPTSLELQVQEGDTGDVHALWNAGRPSFRTHATDGRYLPSAPPALFRGPVDREAFVEDVAGWNRVELLVRGGASVHVVNGRIAARTFAITDGRGVPLRRGRVALQVEGAAITYRAVERLSLDRAGRAPRLLAFTGAAGYRHDSIPATVEALRAVAATHGWELAVSSRAEILDDVLLAAFDVVVLVSTTGRFLGDEGQHALQHFLRSGGGVVAIHGAADAEYERAWYGAMLGARFARHSPVEPGTVEVVSPLAGDLPVRFEHTDEWYEHRAPPPDDATVVLTIDREGRRLPLAWARPFDGGRVFYTSLGHAPEAWARAELRAHLEAAVRYALEEPGEPEDQEDRE